MVYDEVLEKRLYFTFLDQKDVEIKKMFVSLRFMIS